MKFAEIKLENNKITGKNWSAIGFVTPENVLSQIVVDLVHSKIDGIKLVMDLGKLSKVQVLQKELTS